MGCKRWIAMGLAVAGALAVSMVEVPAQTPDASHGAHQRGDSANPQSLTDQVAELRAAVARLEAALARGHKSSPATESEVNTGMMKSMSMAPNGMGGMMGRSMGSSGGMAGMSGMPKMGMGMMDKMGEMGMGMMGSMGATSTMPQSALPGFPGASHLYHVGATGFFLDHAGHVELTTDQRVALNKIKEDVLLAKSTADRDIEEKEQQLWELTAVDQPDVKRIEAKVREIESMRADQRLAYIRAVGDAAAVLTEAQRRTLTGMAETASTTSGSSDDSGQHSH